MLACVTRIMLLLSLAYLARMQSDLFSLFGQNFSIRDLVLIGGGLFLIAKSTFEIHGAMEEGGEAPDIKVNVEGGGESGQAGSLAEGRLPID